jgi:hypothetical protein
MAAKCAPRDVGLEPKFKCLNLIDKSLYVNRMASVKGIRPFQALTLN